MHDASNNEFAIRTFGGAKCAREGALLLFGFEFDHLIVINDEIRSGML
jgi:hypothetical protein